MVFAKLRKKLFKRRRAEKTVDAALAEPKASGEGADRTNTNVDMQGISTVERIRNKFIRDNRGGYDSADEEMAKEERRMLEEVVEEAVEEVVEEVAKDETGVVAGEVAEEVTKVATGAQQTTAPIEAYSEIRVEGLKGEGKPPIQ